MKIQKINIKNFKGISSYEGEINGANVWLIGPNGVNKTNFIDAVWSGISGAKNLPSEPIQQGQKKAMIEIDLGDFIARTKFSKGKATSFELENKNFSSESEKFIKSPRTYLSNRIGVIDFDIYEFFSKTDAEKLNYLSKILDADFSSIDADIEEVIESRKFDKKRLKVLEGTSTYYDKKDAQSPLIDIVKLGKDIAIQENIKSTFERVTTGIQERNDDVDDIDEEIKKLQIKKDKLSAEIKGAQSWILNPDVIPNDQLMQDLDKKLSTANETNKKISEAKTGLLIDIEIEEIINQINEQNDNIVKLRLEKSKQISKSIDVPDLVYDVESEKFIYKGLPFEKNQINTASELIAGMHIASSLLKELKIIRVDASLIDKNNFDQVLKWADENGIELFIELVDRESTQLEIKVENNG
jgi:recombinational DNA repair ATPase RecF